MWKGVPHREVVHRLFKLSRWGFEVKILNFPDDAMMQAAVADCATFNFLPLLWLSFYWGFLRGCLFLGRWGFGLCWLAVIDQAVTVTVAGWFVNR